jgi:hypothetical protein
MLQLVQDTPSLKPQRISRRKLLRSLAGVGAVLGGGAIYATQVEPFWIDQHEITVPIANLPAAFENFRIAHLTDLHAGQNVPISYLSRAIDRVNAAECDCVAVTGDLITHDPDAIDPIVNVLSQLHAPTIVTFGNHDYNPNGGLPGGVTELVDQLAPKLRRIGCTVLRNQVTVLQRNGSRLWVAGLEDLYTTRFFPQVAFAGVPINEPKICLSHNPDGTQRLLPFKPDLILSGHTHGGQVRLPLWGAIILPVSNKKLDQGRFILPHGQLYVSRGVGFLMRVRFDCRPEIPIVKLVRA